MTSVDSGVETGNDSNDSVIVQHESQQQQQYVSYQNIDNNVCIDNAKFDIKINCNETFKLNTNVVDLNHLRDNYPLRFIAECESALGTDLKMEPSMSYHKIITDKHTLYNTNNNLPAVLRYKTKIKTRLRRYGLLNTPVSYCLDQFYARKMQLAAVGNNIEWMRHCLAQGRSPNILANSFKQTPLHHAVNGGFTDMVRLLLHYGADPNCRDHMGSTPLDLAVNIRHMPITCLLLSAGSVLPFDLGEHHLTKLIGKKLYIVKYTKSDEERAKLTYEINSIVFLLRAHIRIKPIRGNVRTQENMQEQIETLSDACSRLSLSSSDKIQDDVKNLLININHLDISSYPRGTEHNAPP